MAVFYAAKWMKWERDSTFSTKIEIYLRFRCDWGGTIRGKMEYGGAEYPERKFLMKILYCFLYLAGTGILGFLIGRIVPKSWFRADRFPFRTKPWEEKLYQLLRVKQWQNKVPDMSRILPGMMPPKRLTPEMMGELPRMIEETCVAEAVHAALSVTGLGFLWIVPGVWGALWTAAYILLGNVAFIVIQRYNRPRLQKLLVMQERKKAKEQRRDA